RSHEAKIENRPQHGYGVVNVLGRRGVAADVKSSQRQPLIVLSVFRSIGEDERLILCYRHIECVTHLRGNVDGRRKISSLNIKADLFTKDRAVDQGSNSVRVPDLLKKPSRVSLE